MLARILFSRNGDPINRDEDAFQEVYRRIFPVNWHETPRDYMSMVTGAIAGIESLRYRCFSDGVHDQRSFWEGFRVVMFEAAGFSKPVTTIEELYIRARSLGQLIGEVFLQYQDERPWSAIMLWLGESRSQYYNDEISPNGVAFTHRYFSPHPGLKDYITKEYLDDEVVMYKFYTEIVKEVSRFPFLDVEGMKTFLTEPVKPEESF